MIAKSPICSLRYYGLAAFNRLSVEMFSTIDGEILLFFFVNILIRIGYESHDSLHVSMMLHACVLLMTTIKW